MAGASAAYELAAGARIILLEREWQCGYHATGRSAASFTENYGTSVVRRLVSAGRSFFENPPEGIAEHPLVGPRGMITVARADQADLLDEELARARQFVSSIVRIGATEAVRLVPVLHPDYVADAIFEPGSMDVDVNALHQGYLRGFKARGGQVVTETEVTGIVRQGQAWSVTTRNGSFSAPVILNAAGAWADEIATMAGLRPLGLVAKRRTAFNVDAPAGMNIDRWPLVNDVGQEFYFKPDAGNLLVSPADAVPTPPSDVQADELDVAVGVDRLQQATKIVVRRVSHRWAGLRTFAPDGSPVVGRDPSGETFFWLAGQGGYGIKTAPALSQVIAGLILQGEIPAALRDRGLSEAELSPRRFATAQPDRHSQRQQEIENHDNTALRRRSADEPHGDP
ncbi:MAG: D-arginine dehydrogenase [Rhodospirillaceae bacterium]|jgi:D-arginine dehydrogenase|nr:D-arginine dehydrogenase [Rhodospirillaceae bacterium]